MLQSSSILPVKKWMILHGIASKALKAIQAGYFSDQILPVEIPEGRKGTRIFDTDEHPRDTPREKLAKLRPAFKADGVITAANSSGINDGAGISDDAS